MEWTERIGRRIRLRDLHILLAVAQWGSMAKAAERLAISQPVVSKTIADLEHMLGVRLLDRSRQGAEPTVYGLALLRHGVAAFDELRQGVNEIEFLADPTAGELRIGAAEPMNAGLLPAILARLRRQYPRIAFRVNQVEVEHQQHELRERRVDVILGRSTKTIAEDIDAEILFHERTFVVAGSHNPWCRRRKVDLAELVNEPWMLPPPEGVVGSLVGDAFRARGLAVPRASLVTVSFQLYSALMADGPFLAILPGSVLRFSAKRLSLKIVPVELAIPPWPVAIATLKKRTISPVAKLFIDCARDMAKPLAENS